MERIIIRDGVPLVGRVLTAPPPPGVGAKLLREQQEREFAYSRWLLAGIRKEAADVRPARY